MFSTIYVWRNDVVEKNRDQYKMRFWDWMIIHIINVAEERYRKGGVDLSGTCREDAEDFEKGYFELKIL
jgi:hypothetical protein